MADDVNEGIENALNVIVSTTGSSGNLKKELKTTIFELVSNLRKLFTKVTDVNDSNARKITELEKQVASVKDARVERMGITNNCTEEPSSAPERTIHGQPENKVTPPGEGKVKLYSEITKGKTIQKIYKLTVTSRDNQTADTIK
jgi:hypothetical protein